MSSRARYGIGAAIILLVTADAAQAQSVEQQRARVATLRARLDTVRARAERQRQREDTVDVAGFRVVVLPESRERAERTVRAAVEEMERSVGAQDLNLIRGTVLTAARRGSASVDDVTVQAFGHFSRLGGAELLRVASRWWEPSATDLEVAYLELVVSPAIAARRCLDGDVDKCSQILGLAPVADPWAELYDRDGRRVAVKRNDDGLGRSPRRAELARQCVDAAEDAACLGFLQTGAHRFPPVLQGRSVRSVLQVARRLGGDGTVTRLVADTTASLDHRLGHASGAPFDSLIRVWHTSVLEAAPRRTATSGASTWATVLAIVTAGALALRSTRWRLA